jgi:hypothetical protein
VGEGPWRASPGVLETNILVLKALHLMNRSVHGGGSMSGQPGALETNILVLKALHLMNRSVDGGGSSPGHWRLIYWCCRPCT